MAVLNIICALPAEAKGLIRALNLKKDLQQKNFQVYHDQKLTIFLIISGVGKINAAIATAVLAQLNPHRLKGFCNIGIAGGVQTTIGDLFIVSKVTDAATQKNYFPKIQFLKKMPAKNLLSVDKPAKVLPENTLVDMEAYGFYQAAVKFTQQEFIHILKIVSDNEIQSSENIHIKTVAQWMQDNEVKLLELIQQQLQNLRTQIPVEAPLMSKVTEKFHVTSHQQLQIQRLLVRADNFSLDTKTMLQQAQSAKTFIGILTTKLSECY